MCEQKIELEQKFEQEQDPQSQGKKILWIVGPENESKIGENLPKILETSVIHGKRIIYNNLRSNDEFPGWKNSHTQTEAELMRQAEQLSSDDCYVLDYLQLVNFSTDMVTFLTMGKALFHAATSRGADCLIISTCRSEENAKRLKIQRLFDWQQRLSDDADIVLQDDQRKDIIKWAMN